MFFIHLLRKSRPLTGLAFVSSGCCSCVCSRFRQLVSHSALLEYVATCFILRVVFLMTRCPSIPIVAISVDRSAICTSSQILQAFSWVCGLLRKYKCRCFVPSCLPLTLTVFAISPSSRLLRPVLHDDFAQAPRRRYHLEVPGRAFSLGRRSPQIGYADLPDASPHAGKAYYSSQMGFEVGAVQAELQDCRSSAIERGSQRCS